MEKEKRTYTHKGLRETARMLGISHTHLRAVLDGQRTAGERLARSILLLTGINVQIKKTPKTGKQVNEGNVK